MNTEVKEYEMYNCGDELSRCAYGGDGSIFVPAPIYGEATVTPGDGPTPGDQVQPVPVTVTPVATPPSPITKAVSWANDHAALVSGSIVGIALAWAFWNSQKSGNK
jgi:hypothetical protein